MSSHFLLVLPFTVIDAADDADAGCVFVRTLLSWVGRFRSRLPFWEGGLQWWW